MADEMHTPGPWEYSGGGIWGNSPWNARVRLADITFHNSINGIASDANGRLIAAAPELFDVLVDLVNLIDDARKQDSGAYTTFHRADAVIEKVMARVQRGQG